MSPSAQLTSEHLTEIIEEETNTDKDVREVKEKVEDGEEVLDPENTNSVLNTVLGTINNKLDHECLDEFQTTPPQGHPAFKSALDLILVVTMPRVAETFKSIIKEKTYSTNFKLVKLLHAENANITHSDRNSSIDVPENRWNIHVVSYDT